jgi:D-tyrosyl-tRNA(Tyr) deacylase
VIALVQRVAMARVEVGGETVGAIGAGALVFVCAEPDDTVAHAERLVAKLLALRIFGDADGRMNRSVQDIGGGVLLVSQFTLYGDLRRGRRPSFDHAAAPETARGLYEDLVRELRSASLPVETGEFQAMMHVELVNDGPVTIIVDSQSRQA